MSNELNNQNETNGIVGEIVKALVPALVTVVGIILGAKQKQSNE